METPQPQQLAPPTLAFNWKKGTSVRLWFVFDSTAHTMRVDAGKHSIMRCTGLPGRDLRILDPLLSYSSTVLGRERVIVINLDHVKAIIMAQEVLLLNSKDPSVTPFGGKAVASATQKRNGNVLVKKQEIQPKVKKTVNFVENGSVYRIVRNGDGILNYDSDDHGEVMEYIIVEENECLDENEQEMNLDNNEESTYDYQIQDGDFVLSAPLPVKMESKPDLMKNRKGSLQIVS